MYTRTSDQKIKTIVNNGKANFGTYNEIPQKLDIRAMRSPYAGVPLPSFISKIRIKSRLNYIFDLKDFMGFTEFYDFKAFGLAEILLWNKNTGIKYAYHAFMANPHRFVPTATAKGRCACYKHTRRIKVSWGREHRHTALSFSLKGDKIRPAIEGFCISAINEKIHTDTLFVNPCPTSSRCSASWISTMSVKGKIEVNHEAAEQTSGLAAMIVNRAYYKFRSRINFCLGMGKVKDKDIIFHIKTSTMDAVNSDDYNDNLLSVDGEVTCLPSVYITHPFGSSKKWIIQDTEGMIDLTFEPVSIDDRTLNVIALRRVSKSLYGKFEGTLLTGKGEKLSFKNLSGIINSSSLRL